MKKLIISILALLLTTATMAEIAGTKRIPQFFNEKVNVWETVVYPKSNQKLTSHRHDFDRVLVAFDNGTLKITNNEGKVHYLKLLKDKAYYLSKNVEGETHTDENIGQHPIRVMVIELKD